LLRRVAAFLIDVVLVCWVVPAVVLVNGTPHSQRVAGQLVMGKQDAQRLVALLAMMVIACLASALYTWLSTWRAGRTLGKRLLGLRVVDLEGAAVSRGAPPRRARRRSSWRCRGCWPPPGRSAWSSAR
jgi:uncharacterized RDD family membrane protein YckC